jgi:serine/threonine protein kinase/tetratricopeptide (TPR) repeat protein
MLQVFSVIEYGTWVRYGYELEWVAGMIGVARSYTELEAVWKRRDGRLRRGMTPEAGQKFGPYEILSRLGGGAMGLVFRAWDARLHREVAIKLLHDDYDMPGMRERFQQEARAASALNHPNICTIFDIGEQDGDPYLVMELLEGETLKEKISRGALAADEIIRYGQEVADALSAAHAKGIVHRDIKPANIFLVDKPSGRPQAKVLDFGLAKIGLTMSGGRASRALDLTLAGATVGTLSYMSPEQARGQNLDERSDLFSLGVVMYEMATRHVPFQGATSALIFVQLLNYDPEPIHEWNEAIPRDLEKIILKLLTKARDGRFQTANALSEALRKIPFKASGGWLKKAASVVPLVRAADPVARSKRPLRTSPGSNRVASGPRLEGAKGTLVKPISSGDNMLIRPVARVPQKDSGSRGESVESPDMPLSEDEAKRIASDQAQLNGSDEAGSALQETNADARSEDIAIPARSRSGVTQFEFDADVLVAAPKASSARSFNGAIALGDVRKTLEPVTAKPQRGGMRLAVASVLLVTVVGGVFFLVNNVRFRPVLLEPADPLLLTVIQNRTNDKALDGVVVEGLELVLRQSRYLTVRGGEAYRAGIQQTGGEVTSGQASNRRIAQMLGAKAYLYGEIKGSGAPYTIDIEVLKSDSNDRLTSVEETADGKDQLAAAIDRIAVALRSNLGESDQEIAKTSGRLGFEGSADLKALHAYAMGETAMQGGRVSEAISDYELAISADPKFSEAHVQLAWLYANEKAETAAASEAKLAAATAEDGSDRLKLLAQFCDAMNGSGDYGRAAGIMRQFKELYPHDVAGELGMARMLRAQGHLPEALQAALQASGHAPYLAEAYLEAEAAMVGMDREQGALQLQEQAKRLGVVRTGSALASAYLAGDAAVLMREINAVKGIDSKGIADKTRDSYGAMAEYGLYLDNKGQLTAGGAFWRSTAASAGNTSALHSTEASMLAMGALDRSLTNECGQAAAFVREANGLPMGQVASFDAGMAAALCGDHASAEKIVGSLKQTYPQSTAVIGYYVADLQAAMALQVKEPKQALAILAGASAFDQISLTPYLRGLAHMGTGETSLAIADFQTIVDHRGAAFIAGSNVYPMAQIGLARAYAAIGDKVNSTAAYKEFLESWHEADHGQALVAEAIAKSR